MARHAARASAPTCTTSWASAVSGNWNDPTKWTNGVPTSSCAAKITVAGIYTVTLSGYTGSAATLTLGSGTVYGQFLVVQATDNCSGASNAELSLAAGGSLATTGVIELTQSGSCGGGTPSLETGSGTLSNGGIISTVLGTNQTTTALIDGTTTNTTSGRMPIGAPTAFGENIRQHARQPWRDPAQHGQLADDLQRRGGHRRQRRLHCRRGERGPGDERRHLHPGGGHHSPRGRPAHHPQRHRVGLHQRRRLGFDHRPGHHDAVGQSRRDSHHPGDRLLRRRHQRAGDRRLELHQRRPHLSHPDRPLLGRHPVADGREARRPHQRQSHRGHGRPNQSTTAQLDGNITNIGEVWVNAPISFGASIAGSTFDNHGGVALGATLSAENDAAVIDDTGGLFNNGRRNGSGPGHLLVNGGTYTQGAGSISQTAPVPTYPAIVLNSAALHYTGKGKGSILAEGSIPETGSLATGQELALQSSDSCGGAQDAVLSPAKSLSNSGTITFTHAGSCAGGSDTLMLPSGVMLTNEGTLSAVAGAAGRP